MSFPGIKRLGVDVTATSTTQEHELGLEVKLNNGATYKYVLAAEALTAYKPVDWTVAFSASVTDNGDLIYGVPQTTIASGSYGWVLVSGPGTIMMSASQAACIIGQVSAVGGLGNVAAAATAGDGARGETFATEAGTPAGVSCYLL